MSDLKNIFQYHNNSKHSYYSFAPGPGYMDWDSQPDPFRTYEGADTVSLKQILQAERPFFSEALKGSLFDSFQVNFDSISQFPGNSEIVSGGVSVKYVS